jgi:hypothetical protein
LPKLPEKPPRLKAVEGVNLRGEENEKAAPNDKLIVNVPKFPKIAAKGRGNEGRGHDAHDHHQYELPSL